MRIKLVTLILGVAVAALVLAAPATASKRQFVIFDATAELLGEYGEAAKAQAFADMQFLGVDMVRFLVYWKDIAPSPHLGAKPKGFNPRNHMSYGPNGSRWATVDAVVRGARARGMRVILVPTGKFPGGQVPRWASHGKAQNDPDPKEFENFMFALGSRYRGRVSMVGMWNEPNSKVFLGPRGKNGALYSADLYRRLFIAGKTGLRQSGFQGKILLGELGPRGALPWLQDMLCVNSAWRRKQKCPRITANGFAMHPYTLFLPPWFTPPEPGLVAIGTLGRLFDGLNKAARAGAINRMPVYITEYGYQSKPDLLGLSLSKQAAFMSIAERIARENKRVKSFAQFLLRDDENTSFGFQTGLRFHWSNGGPCSLKSSACKPAYFAFRTPLAVRVKRGKAKKVTIWGRIRPGNRRWAAQVWFKDKGKRRPRLLARVSTDRWGGFYLRTKNKKGRRYQLRWRNHEGPFTRAFKY